jgi:hypothetical protein
MGSEQVQDLETRAREAILDYVFAPNDETRDKLEIIYEVVRFTPACKNNPAYRGIRKEMEYTLGITGDELRCDRCPDIEDDTDGRGMLIWVRGRKSSDSFLRGNPV